MAKNVLTAMTIGFIANTNLFPFLPKVSLIAIMSAAMVIDLALGLLRAKMAGKLVTEKGLQKTLVKFLQYGGCIFVGLGISYLSMEVSKYNESWKYTPQFMSFMNNSLLVYIIGIEGKSIIRHLIALDSKSEVSTTILTPVLKVLSIQLKNNPLIKLTVEAGKEDELTVTQKTIKPKAK